MIDDDFPDLYLSGSADLIAEAIEEMHGWPDLYTHLSPSPLKKYPPAAAGDTPVDTRSATPPVPRDGR